MGLAPTPGLLQPRCCQRSRETSHLSWRYSCVASASLNQHHGKMLLNVLIHQSKESHVILSLKVHAVKEYQCNPKETLEALLSDLINPLLLERVLVLSSHSRTASDGSSGLLPSVRDHGRSRRAASFPRVPTVESLPLRRAPSSLALQKAPQGLGARSGGMTALQDASSIGPSLHGDLTTCHGGQ